MKQHGILMSAPMVRAILEGRKTQTRRVVTRNNSTVLGYIPRSKRWEQWWSEALWDQAGPTQRTGEALHVPCGGEWADGAIYRVRPIWEPGNRLWVRETWCEVPIEMGSDHDEYIYRADMTKQNEFDFATEQRVERWRAMTARWRPSIHMPRSAARIVLEVIAARGERVQSISDADALAEGIDHDNGISCRTEFQQLWEGINTHRPGCAWQDNPWVWVIRFARVNV